MGQPKGGFFLVILVHLSCPMSLQMQIFLCQLGKDVMPNWQNMQMSTNLVKLLF